MYICIYIYIYTLCICVYIYRERDMKQISHNYIHTLEETSPPRPEVPQVNLSDDDHTNYYY